MGVPANRWYIIENPIRMDDLGVPPWSASHVVPGPVELNMSTTPLAMPKVTWAP